MNQSINNSVLEIYQASLKTERDWLQSNGLPLERLPDTVAKAVAMRVLIAGFPIETNQYLFERITSDQILNSIVD